MSRREFSTRTKREAYERSKGLCEGILASGERCNANLSHKPHHYDHIIPDGIGGKNDLQNCQTLCKPCHKAKTDKIDIPIIAKSKRVRDRHLGIARPRQTIKSAGFAKAPGQRRASTPIDKWRGYT